MPSSGPSFREITGNNWGWFACIFTLGCERALSLRLQVSLHCDAIQSRPETHSRLDRLSDEFWCCSLLRWYHALQVYFKVARWFVHHLNAWSLNSVFCQTLLDLLRDRLHDRRVVFESNACSTFAVCPGRRCGPVTWTNAASQWLGLDRADLGSGQEPSGGQWRYVSTIDHYA